MRSVFRKPVAMGLMTAVALVAAGVMVAVATGGTAKRAANVQVCVLLPDTKSSVRWMQFDPPYIAAGAEEGRRHLFDEQRPQRPAEDGRTGRHMPR